jgi:hypothetical protein
VPMPTTTMTWNSFLVAFAWFTRETVPPEAEPARLAPESRGRRRLCAL